MILRNLLKHKVNDRGWKGLVNFDFTGVLRLSPVNPITIRCQSTGRYIPFKSLTQIKRTGPRSETAVARRKSPNLRSKKQKEFSIIEDYSSPKAVFRLLATEPPTSIVKKTPKYQLLSGEEKALRYISHHKLIKDILDQALLLTDRLYNERLQNGHLDTSTASVQDLFNLRLECSKIAMKECFERRRVKFFRRISSQLFPRWRPASNASIETAIDLYWAELVKARDEADKEESVQPWKDWIAYVNISRDPPIIPDLRSMEKGMEQFGLTIFDKQNNIKIYNLASMEILCRSFAKYFMRKVIIDRQYDPLTEVNNLKVAISRTSA